MYASTQIAMNISDILSFWLTLYLTHWWRYSNFKIWPTLWPGDDINDVMNTDIYKYSHNPMIPMSRKYIWYLFLLLVIMINVLISFIKEYRGPILRPPCDVIDDVITMKKTFLGIIWDDPFISEADLIFQNVWNGRHFEGHDKLFYRKCYRMTNIPVR